MKFESDLNWADLAQIGIELELTLNYGLYTQYTQ